VLKKYLITLFCYLAIHSLPDYIIAQYNFNGFLRNETGLRTSSNPDFLFARNIFHIDSGYLTSNLALKTSVQIRQDLLNGNHFSPEIQIKQAYFERIWSRTEFKMGRQMIVWGRSDATQINDIINPFDVSEFLTQDFSDLRQGVTAMNATFFSSSNHFQFIIIPIFEKPRIYEAGGSWDPLAQSDIKYEITKIPKPSLNNIQYAFRYENRSLLQLDFDISIFRGFNRFPYLLKEVIANQLSSSFDLIATRGYKISTIFMSSAEYRVTPKLVGVYEINYWTKRYFDVIPPSLRKADSPALDVFREIQIYNDRSFLRTSPFIQSMIGFKSTISSYSYSIQYVNEFIPNHTTDMLPDQLFHFASLLLNWASNDTNWQVRLLSRYQMNGKDYWFNPDLNYALSDGFRLSSGIHYFNGPTPSELYGNLSFNSYRDNSFVYLKLTTFW
jgi:hypothetical protein